MNCPNCDRVLTPHGKTKAGNQRYLCRKDRGGCGFGLVIGDNNHGGLRHKKYESNAERQKAYRERKKPKRPESP